MNKEEDDFLKEVLSDHDVNAIELQEISREGRRLMDDAEDITDQIASRNRLNVAMPFRLKGLLGMTLGGMAGIWGVRSAWQAYQGGSDEQAAGVKTRRISKSALANQTSFLPKPASLVMDQIPTNSSYFLDTTILDHDSILEKLLSQKLMLDMHYLVPSENYYKKYIDVIFQDAISKSIENPQNGLLDKTLFKRELIQNFKYLLSFFAEGTMINSPGLCNLKKYCLSIYQLLIKNFDDPSKYYTVFKPHEVSRNLSIEAIGASKLISIDGLYNELIDAVDSLIKEGTCADFSFDVEIIMKYTRLASSEIALLDLSDPLEKLIFNNILIKLNHLNEIFYRRAGTPGSWGKFTFNAIKNALTFGSLPSRGTELFTCLLIAHATIIPDLIGFRKDSACKSTDLRIFNSLLLDMKNERVRKVGNFFPSSSTAIPEANEQTKVKHVKYKLPNTTQTSSTNKDAKQKTTGHKKLGSNNFFNATTTTFPVNQANEAKVRADIIKAALLAIGLKSTIVASGVLSQTEKLEKLRKLVLKGPTSNIPPRPEQQPPKSPELIPTMLPEQNMEDWNKPVPSSFSDFTFPRISDELNSRASFTKDRIIYYVNTHYKNVDISRPEEYLNEYFKQRLDSYEALHREGYFVSEGLALEPQTEQLNIRSAKMMVAEHLDFVNVAIERTRQLFDIILDETPKNQMQVKYITEYLVDYFKNTLNIEDDSIITEVLFRLNEVASRGAKYLHTFARNRFKNIWFVSTRGNVEESARTGDFVTNLDSASIHSIPMFSAVY